MVLEAIREKERFTPRAGYNVVGLDTYERPGEQLYLIGHYRTREEAERSLARWQSDNPGEIAHVYGSQGRTSRA